MWTHINSIWLDGIIPDDTREEISAVEHENPRNIKGGNLNAMATWSSVRVYAEIRSSVRVYAEINVHWTAPAGSSVRVYVKNQQRHHAQYKCTHASSVRVYAEIRSSVRVYAEINTSSVRVYADIKYHNENEEEPAAEQPLKKLQTSRREEPAAAPPATQIVHWTEPTFLFI